MAPKTPAKFEDRLDKVEKELKRLRDLRNSDDKEMTEEEKKTLELATEIRELVAVKSEEAAALELTMKNTDIMSLKGLATGIVTEVKSICTEIQKSSMEEAVVKMKEMEERMKGVVRVPGEKKEGPEELEKANFQKVEKEIARRNELKKQVEKDEEEKHKKEIEELKIKASGNVENMSDQELDTYRKMKKRELNMNDDQKEETWKERSSRMNGNNYEEDDRNRFRWDRDDRSRSAGRIGENNRDRGDNNRRGGGFGGGNRGGGGWQGGNGGGRGNGNGYGNNNGRSGEFGGRGGRRGNDRY